MLDSLDPLNECVNRMLTPVSSESSLLSSSSSPSSSSSNAQVIYTGPVYHYQPKSLILDGQSSPLSKLLTGGATKKKVQPAGGLWTPQTCALRSNGFFTQYELSSGGHPDLYGITDLTCIARADVRLVDESLLERRHVFSIRDRHGVVQYFSAPTRKIRLTWTSLLKQATGKVEAKGDRYRPARALNLRVSEIRGWKGEANARIELGGELVARTMTKGSPTEEPYWIEDFNFSELRTLGDHLVFYIHSGGRGDARIGKVKIPMIGIRKGHLYDEWYPIYDDRDGFEGGVGGIGAKDRFKAGPSGKRGELRLRFRYDRLTVLPTAQYKDMINELGSQQAAYVPYDLSIGTIGLERLAETLLRIYVAQGKEVEWMCEMVEHDLGDSADPNIIFRANTVFTKAVDAYMKLIGWQYMDDTVGGVIRSICKNRVTCELDPLRADGQAQVESSIEQLSAYANALWRKVQSSQSSFPTGLRRLFTKIRSIVMSRYASKIQEATSEGNSTSPDPPKTPVVQYTCVSGFLFLRLICPAILSPRLFELTREHPEPPTQRTLTLLAKSVQSLANLSDFGIKEPYMMPMNDFIKENTEGLKEFIDFVASTPPEGLAPEEPPKYPVKEGTTFAPPRAPYNIDRDRELALLALHISQNREALMSLAKDGTKGNGTKRVCAEGTLDRWIRLCDRIQSRVSRRHAPRDREKTRVSTSRERDSRRRESRGDRYRDRDKDRERDGK